MKSGWLSILQNEKQLLVHSRNVNNVVQIRAAHNALENREKKQQEEACGMWPKTKQEDKQCVQDLVSCMHEFDSFPFNPASPTLRTLLLRCSRCCRNIQLQQCAVFPPVNVSLRKSSLSMILMLVFPSAISSGHTEHRSRSCMVHKSRRRSTFE